MTDLNSIETARPAFDAFTTLLAIMGDPAAYKANMEALAAKFEAIAEGERRLEADRAAHEAKVAADKAEIAEDRRRAAGVWRIAQEEQLKAAGLLERAEAYAAKVGYWEKPTHIAIGESGIEMAVIDKAPARPTSAAAAPVMVAEPFEGGLTGGRIVARPRGRGRA
jgi:hypothetical protein